METAKRIKKLLYDFHFEEGKSRLKSFGLISALGMMYALVNAFLLQRAEDRVSLESLIVVAILVVFWPFLVTLVEDWPSLPDFRAIMREGDFLRKGGYFAEAHDCYRNLLSTSRLYASRKDRIHLLVRLEITSREIQDVSVKGSYLNKALNLTQKFAHQRNPIAFEILAEGLLNLRDYGATIAIFEELLTSRARLDRSRLSYLRYLHDSYIRLGDLDQASLYLKLLESPDG